MREERINTIVTEIHYWKEHQLLPDKYCDYLLALYTNGEGTSNTVNNSAKFSSKVLQIIFVSILLPFSFFVLYFTQIELALQLGMLLLFLCYSGWTYVTMKNRNNTLYHLGLITSLFLAFLSLLTIGKLLHLQGIYLSFVFALNFSAWIFLGVKNSLRYLVIIGIIALLFTCLYTIL
ncbi:hypothetical protein [Oceanobacillus manasiensis]|uniref:hypothetical protein n=1 Tax=Oceanobacillus manasiensis TaxID=586413 RepID=UPI0006942E0D|nr:hypothetical protein [Oceanobacillus manasiensis]